MKKTKLATSFEEICEIKGYDIEKSLPTVSSVPEQFRKQIIALAKAMIITEYLNDGWIPDWDNYYEWKYVIWFSMDKPGFRLYVVRLYVSFTHSGAGSRLCFRTRALAEHAAKYFLEIYKELMAY